MGRGTGFVSMAAGATGVADLSTGRTGANRGGGGGGGIGRRSNIGSRLEGEGGPFQFLFEEGPCQFPAV